MARDGTEHSSIRRECAVAAGNLNGSTILKLMNFGKTFGLGTHFPVELIFASWYAGISSG